MYCKIVAPDLAFGMHTLRASDAITAANAVGVSDRCIKRHGRWKADSSKDAIEGSLEQILLITKKLKM